MGREIRMVPANWDHPKQEGQYDGRLQPMFDKTFAEAAAEWKAEFASWERGARPDYCSEESRDLEFWEWNGEPPDRKYFRPWKEDDAIWFQVWETVSEGTPVSPPFATKAELVDYLVANGDFWDQKRREGGWERKAAESFVGVGYAPSMVVQHSAAGSEIFTARDSGMYSAT
jgi:hypothetical protein